ncbi:MAG: hypothetical protein WC810_27040, partial [Janthinobacterium sp.]
KIIHYRMAANNYYCTTCGTTNLEEQECCGSMMIETSEVEGFGLSDVEPKGSDGYETVDEWN